jgi:phosphoglycerate kinase
MDKVVINQLPVEKLRGQRVFVRIDADAELSASGALFDESKLRSSLPTLEYLRGVGARAVIGASLGKPGGRVIESLRLDPVAERLSRMLGSPVRKLGEAIGRGPQGAVAGMRDGDLLLLENLRFHPGEDANDAEFARELAELCDVYCNDAFALANLALASTVGVTRRVRPAAAGLALARELMMFEAALDQPDPPFVGLIAGARLEEKLPVLENLMPRLNRLFIGGALAFTFLEAKRREIGSAPVDRALLPLVKDFLKKAEKEVEVILPEDFITVQVDEFREYEKSGRAGDPPEWRLELENGIPPFYMPVDVGPATVNRIKGLFEGAHTILWNGPLGVWEIEPFGAATRAVALLILERVSPRHQRSILCGDSLARAIRSFNLPVELIRHLTTGGEPSLQLLAGNPLPAVSALDNELDLVAPIETRPRRILLPVDGSEHSLEAARKLGRLIDAEDAEISLLHVQKPEAFAVGKAWIDPDATHRREILRRREAELIFDIALAPLAQQGLTVRQQSTVEGDPADEILKFADEIGADLIVMGSHGRTGVLRVLMGSVSRKVLGRAKCPVLIVRIPERRMAGVGTLET